MGGSFGSSTRAVPAPRRTRRVAILVVAIVLLVSGVGLAVGLHRASTSKVAVPVPTRPAVTADQQLAAAVQLTRGDLPPGWSVDSSPSSAGSTGADRAGQIAITRAFATCMGLTDQQGSTALGGGASDQTAQAASPIFLGPTPTTRGGSSLELQTEATVVRTHGDEEADFALLARPRYPQCAATAVASEVQLGVNDASGASDRPGPASVSVAVFPRRPNLHVFGLVATFTVTDATASIPVQVEVVSLGSDRLEAQLQAFAIGGRIPSTSVVASIATFEERVVGRGSGVSV
jgi:hypothetical protein